VRLPDAVHTADALLKPHRVPGDVIVDDDMAKLQAEIQHLPVQKAQAMADFVSNQKVIELNRCLQGLQASSDRGPLDAVLQANRALAAKARVSERLSGTDVRAQDAEYTDAERSSSIDDEFSSIDLQVAL